MIALRKVSALVMAAGVALGLTTCSTATDVDLLQIDASGAITYQYLSMTGELSSSTLGIQDASKTVGLQVAFNQAYVHDDLAVRINAIPQWLTTSPTFGRLASPERDRPVDHDSPHPEVGAVEAVEEGRGREGNEVPISPEDAARLLESFDLDRGRTLPMGFEEEADPDQQKEGRNW